MWPLSLRPPPGETSYLLDHLALDLKYSPGLTSVYSTWPATTAPIHQVQSWPDLSVQYLDLSEKSFIDLDPEVLGDSMARYLVPALLAHAKG